MASRRRTAGASGSVIIVTIVAVLGYTYVPALTGLVNGISDRFASAGTPDLPDSGTAGSQLASDLLDALGGGDAAGSTGASTSESDPNPTPSSGAVPEPVIAQGGTDQNAEPAGSTHAATAADQAKPAPGAALVALKELPVKGRAPMTGYSRDQFGPAWTDDTSAPLSHNGCDTRNDILQRDLTDVVFKTGQCVVASGELADPYSGSVIDFVRGQDTSGAVQIDHRVALANAWVTGAQQMSPQARADLANDPLNLQATSGDLNQQKSDGDAATWLPPSQSYRCTYVSFQVAVKVQYRLWVTTPEKAAMEAILATCPEQVLPEPRR